MLGHFPRHPLGHPNCAALRVRCVARPGGGACKLASLRHRKHLFPASPALLARADGDWGSRAVGNFLGHGIAHKLKILSNFGLASA